MHMTRDCWKDFADSGRVSDYLKYREQERCCVREPAAAAGMGGLEHGTDNCPDGHGAVGNACG